MEIFKPIYYYTSFRKIIISITKGLIYDVPLKIPGNLNDKCIKHTIDWPIRPTFI